MFDKFAEVMPKAAGIGLLAYAAFSWAITGPEMASRIIKADHIPRCEKGFADDIRSRAEAAARAVPEPRPDPQREAAAEQLRQHLRKFQQSPFGQLARQHPIAGMGTDQMVSALQAYEQEKAQARDLYLATIRRVREATETRLGNAGNYCGCLGDAAIDEARTEFAVMAATFGVIRPAKVRDLDLLLAQQKAKGKCAAIQPGA